MHLRSPYHDSSPDFDDLAANFPSLKPYVKKSQINFKDPNALRELTKALLKRDFGLSVELPDDRLCPPVPNRLNYVLWIQDLLDTTPNGLSFRDTPESRSITGYDIGTGASCIYPLLACVLRPWTMFASDIDEKSIQFAMENVQRNSFGPRIKVLITFKEGPLLPLNLFQIERLDFCMCNPPFYEDADDLYRRAESKALEPLSACTGSANEMCTPGGEVSFISRLIDESLNLRERVRWYSSLLGKLSSVSTLVTKLKAHNNYAVTEFVQGATKRWGIAWSFLPFRPREDVACPTALALRAVCPKSTRYVINAPLSPSFTIPILQRSLSSLSTMQYEWENSVCIVAFAGNVWSRSARRKQATPQEPTQEESHAEVKLGVRIADKEVYNGSQVDVEWRIGTDVLLFQSFCGRIKSIVQQSHPS